MQKRWSTVLVGIVTALILPTTSGGAFIAGGIVGYLEGDSIESGAKYGTIVGLGVISVVSIIRLVDGTASDEVRNWWQLVHPLVEKSIYLLFTSGLGGGVFVYINKRNINN
ncbi:hypothetical protein NGM10_05590 [Halorussus salilacus]|uniref:DUF5518 domain-containing protein n=1 Tax=Halorussus salilacus TaxID=2953750 RepID=UPI0020A1C8BC|nr:hypothetical protein [Halorussus salilacus]USZ69212.1 hypothetical protein NGM10_05590 [Halorussus salilacus]